MTFEEILNTYKNENENLVCEVPTYLLKKQQGEFTTEDYFHLPEGMSVELIEGEFVYMNSGTDSHQRLLLLLAMALEAYIKKNHGKCRTYTEFNVQPRESDKTVFKPDVVLLCDASKNKGTKIVGAPDLVIEIISPSTKNKDTGIKKKIYKETGVREYWLVDVDNKCITVHQFEAGDKTTIYGIDDVIPVGVFDKECKIDFNEIMMDV